MSHNVRPCPLCAQTRARPCCEVNGIEIARCGACGLLYRPQIPENLAELYGEAYYRGKNADEPQWGGSGNYIADEPRLLKSFDEHLAQMEAHRRPPGKLLDVGCAAGFLLEAARRRGWTVTGLDLSDFATRYAREHFGLDARVGNVSDAPFEPASFDVITAFEYIEHVEDPVATLRAIRPWLKPDGLLVMTTPNAGGWQARRHPERFDGFLEQRHLAYFSRPTMTQLLRATGFDPLSIRSDMNVVTAQGLARGGASRQEGLRRWVNRFAPGLKTAVRQAAGGVWGGTTLKVYARPVQPGPRA